jgi:GYD domain
MSRAVLAQTVPTPGAGARAGDLDDPGAERPVVLAVGEGGQQDPRSARATVRAQWATLGDWNFVNVIEAPDDKPMAGISLELGSPGTAPYETLVAIPIDEFIAGDRRPRWPTASAPVRFCVRRGGGAGLTALAVGRRVHRDVPLATAPRPWSSAPGCSSRAVEAPAAMARPRLGTSPGPTRSAPPSTRPRPRTPGHRAALPCHFRSGLQATSGPIPHSVRQRGEGA